jgi:hypothetical protein
MNHASFQRINLRSTCIPHWSRHVRSFPFISEENVKRKHLRLSARQLQVPKLNYLPHLIKLGMLGLDSYLQVSRWEDVIEMDLREMGWGGMVWFHLARGRDQWRALVNTVI